MYRTLPLAMLLFAAGSFAGTLDEIPFRKDVPDAVVVPRANYDYSKYSAEDAIRIMREKGAVNELLQIIRANRRDLLDIIPREDVPDAILGRLIYTYEEFPEFNFEPLRKLDSDHQLVLEKLRKDGTRFEVIGDEIYLTPPTFGPWRELFNGKDIENWKIVGKAIWKVEDGVIVGGQFGDPKRGGLLHTADSFTDFELELEFMIDEHGKYNSGVYLRNDADTAARTGYQVNIGRGAAGEFCGGVYTTDWLAKGDETDTVRKIGEWNKFRILAIGAKVEVDLNGKRIVTLLDGKPDPKFLQKGVIGLQTYGAEGHDGWVKFKNIRIREVKK